MLLLGGKVSASVQSLTLVIGMCLCSNATLHLCIFGIFKGDMALADEVFLGMDKMRSGERAEVTRVAAKRNIKRRLFDLGLIPGREVECVGNSPGGDPSAYLICGALIALRARDVADITVKLKDRQNEIVTEAQDEGI